VQTMIARRLSFVVLAITASLAWMGCQPAAQPPVANQQSPPLAQKEDGPKPVRMKGDENWLRVRLLAADAVQNDLGLTANQRKEITVFLEVSRERMREFHARFPESTVLGVTVHTSEERVREQRAWLEDWQSKQKDMRAKLVGMLTPSQSERLRQIQLQQTIAAALANPDYVKALDISEEQLAKIRPLPGRVDEKLFAEAQALNGLPLKERRKKEHELAKGWDKAQAEANRHALEVLRPEQRAKLEKLTGKEIEVTWDYDALEPGD
jgi:hypothetical protein